MAGDPVAADPGRALARRARSAAGRRALGLRRHGARRALSAGLPLIVVLLRSGFALAAPVADDGAARRLADRRVQIAELERMLAGSAAPGVLAGRSARLHRLAELRLEVAVLAEQERRDGALGAAATTCRRLLVGDPGYRRAAAVRLLLAQVELRRGRGGEARRAVAELERLAPGSPLRCDGWLLNGEAWTRSGDHRRAARWLRKAATSAPCERRGLAAQATYQLAWSLIRGGDPAAGARVLEGLLPARLKPLLRQRVLRDLALTWSTTRPPGAAARLLIHRGGPALGWPLVEQLAGKLADQGRVADLLAFTDVALAERPSPRVARALLRRRLDGIARLGRPADLERELTCLSRRPPADRRAVAEAAAAALLTLAARQLPQALQAATAAPQVAISRAAAPQVAISGAATAAPAGRRAARALLERVTRDFGATAVAAVAWRRLGDLALDAGELLPAARAYREAERRWPATSTAEATAARAELGYRLAFCYQRLLARAESAGVSSAVVAARGRFIAAGRRFARRHPAHRRAGPVRVAVAEELLRAGLHREALAAARAGLEHAQASVRGQSLDLALSAGAALSRWPLVWQLAHAALGRCGGAGAPADVDDPRLAGSPGGPCPRPRAELRRRAAEAALRQALTEADADRLRPASTWAVRAIRLGVAAGLAGLAGRARWAAATIAARRGAVAEADRIYRVLASAPGKGPAVRAGRRRALIARGELAEAAGRFSAAASCYERASALAPGLTRQLALLSRAAEAAGHARDRRAGLSLSRRIGRIVGGLPESSRQRWLLRRGALLARLDRERAVRHYLRAASGLRPARRWLAARALLAAAELAPRQRQRGLYRQAALLAGPLRRRGRPSPLAAQAVVSLAVAERARLARAPVTASRRRRLEALVGELAPVVLLGHPRWSAAAALQLAWAFGELARPAGRVAAAADEPGAHARTSRALRPAGRLLQRRRALLGRLARLAGRSGGLNRYTLAATAHPPAGLRLAGEPGPLGAATVRLLGRGRAEAALRASGRALALSSRPQRAALRCARAVAEATLGRPERAWLELLTALEEDPTKGCARANLQALAAQRGAPRLARAALARVDRKLGGRPRAFVGRAGRATNTGR